MRFTKTRPQHWELSALLFTMSVWVFLTSPANNVKMQETGPTVYRPYPRRLEYLTKFHDWSKLTNALKEANRYITISVLNNKFCN